MPAARLHRTAVIGSGYMGGGIAHVLALSDRDVVLADVDASTAVASRERLIRQAADYASRSLFPADAAERVAARVRTADSIEEASAGADYITEAVPEVPEIKADVLALVSAAARPDAIIGSNTSAIPIRELAGSVTEPERFLGVHWMNPAPFVPGVELIPTDLTDARVLPLVRELLTACGKVPVQVADSPGFVANRLQFALFREAVRMVEEGLADPGTIDAVVSNSFGFRLALFGPFAVADMAGLDVYARAYESLEAAYGERLASPAALDELVSSGRLGTKTGGGFLDVDSDRLPELVAYRDDAYARLSSLRSQLGAAPGLAG